MAFQPYRVTFPQGQDIYTDRSDEAVVIAEQRANEGALIEVFCPTHDWQPYDELTGQCDICAGNMLEALLDDDDWIALEDDPDFW